MMESSAICRACLTPNPNNSKLIVCKECKTQFYSRGATYNEYSGDYFVKRGNLIPAIEIAKIKTFKYFWKKVFPINGSVLEIGCGPGLGIRAANELGIDAWGYDVDPSILNYAKEEERKKIIINKLDTLQDMKFKAIGFFDSFEHIPDLKGFFIDLEKLVLPGSKLLLILPRVDSLSRFLLGKLWPHYTPDHWIHYSLKGLDSILSRHNYKIIKTFFPYKCLNLRMVLNHISILYQKTYKINAAKNPWILDKISFWFNIGEIGIIAEHL